MFMDFPWNVGDCFFLGAWMMAPDIFRWKNDNIPGTLSFDIISDIPDTQVVDDTAYTDQTWDRQQPGPCSVTEAQHRLNGTRHPGGCPLTRSERHGGLRPKCKIAGHC